MQQKQREQRIAASNGGGSWPEGAEPANGAVEEEEAETDRLLMQVP